jgi:transposase-like protein
MATRENFHENVKPNVLRKFSEDFKRDKVGEIQAGITRISEVCKEYDVSHTAIYKWLYKYSDMKKKTKVVVEQQSDTVKLLMLRQRVADLERSVGQKQIIIDFMEKMIEMAEETYQVDIKKKFGGEPLSGSGKTGKNMHTR